MKDNAQIYPFQDEYFQPVTDIFLRAVKEIASSSYTPAQIAAWSAIEPEQWRARLRSGGVWLVRDGEKVTGFIKIDADGYLDLLFVNPDYIRRGVATRLLQKAYAVAEESGLTRIVTDASIAAKPFFAAQQFSIVQQQQVSLRGEIFINYRMEKILIIEK
ncbi:GNAT family N-acetyltransferase [Pantoea sp. PSNIH4]|nr:hypothetical protein PSNIH2_07000 [Pantoea sp. PSNIH2]POU44566.1 GNAT family N-acetyltransferase [Pantoea sp. PSNIH5]POU65362.1 GNAT family N-acetyltransferase [Pantoea sp. PSNIH4]POY66812.1 GNAT family N-acetyltransferase [Pantoea sp. PSNIH3]